MDHNEQVGTTAQACATVGCQTAEVCVPITVAPYAQAGRITTNCCGCPIVCTGERHCKGKKNGTCYLTISQKINVEIPVQFGATAVVGDAFVDCLGSSGKEDGGKCHDCYDENHYD